MTDTDTRTVPDDVVRDRVRECLACSLSGHWPMVGEAADTFVAELNDEALRRWENYTEGRLGVSCCGRSREDFPVPA